LSTEFYYRVNWRAQGAHAGQHPGGRAGGGFEFLGHVPLADHPDARRLDIRASLSQPHGQWLVKQFRQRAAIPVYLLADLSASMGFRGVRRKTELLAEFAQAIAWAAWRSGDPFGLFACDSAIRWELSLPPRPRKGLTEELRLGLSSFQPSAAGARGLLEATALLGREKALVFLASDFHFGVAELERLLESLARHDLVPVALWDSAEYENLPSFGLAELRDPETGARRRLFLRPALAEKIRLGYAERREELKRLCVRHGREPFFLVDRFDPDALSRYFYPA
jgi:uncharacterized protein (DUF58 family)